MTIHDTAPPLYVLYMTSNLSNVSLSFFIMISFPLTLVIVVNDSCIKIAQFVFLDRPVKTEIIAFNASLDEVFERTLSPIVAAFIKFF